MALFLAVMMLAFLDSHRCATWGLLGVLGGCAAYAQDDPSAVVAGGGELGLWLELLKAGGLPAVLGFTGWLFGRGGLPVTIQLSETDRKLIEKLADDDKRRK